MHIWTHNFSKHISITWDTWSSNLCHSWMFWHLQVPTDCCRDLSQSEMSNKQIYVSIVREAWNYQNEWISGIWSILVIPSIPYCHQIDNDDDPTPADGFELYNGSSRGQRSASKEHLFVNANDNCEDLSCDDKWLNHDSTNMARHFVSVDHLFVNGQCDWWTLTCVKIHL